MREANKTAAILAILGGIIMLIAGITGAAAWEKLGDQAVELSGIDALAIVFQILVVMGSLGGLLVILGGLLFSWDKVGGGKVLIAIGAGMGLIGLIIFLVITLMSDDPGGNIIGALSIGFVGLILSIVARMKAD
jgi:cbb3-type cytochrome oxidase subunit 1